MVRASGYLKTLDDFRAIPLACARRHPGALGDVATVQARPGDAARHRRARRRRRGGRWRGHPALGARTRSRPSPRARLAELQGSLPGRGDRHHLRPQRADRARHRQPRHKLVEEFVVVARGLCVVFLWHLRSALVASSRCRWACWRPSGDALAGHQRQHHVAGRHRHRHRRDGRRGGGDDRERAQEARRPGSTRTRARRWSARRAGRSSPTAAEEVGPALFFRC